MKKKRQRPTVIFITDLETEKKYTLREIADLTGIKSGTIRQRYDNNHGISFKEICKPLRKSVSVINPENIDQYISVNECASELGYTINFMLKVAQEPKIDCFKYKGGQFIEKSKLHLIQKEAEEQIKQSFPGDIKHFQGKSRRVGKVEVQLLLPELTASFLRYTYGNRRKGGVSGHIDRVAKNDPGYSKFLEMVRMHEA